MPRHHHVNLGVAPGGMDAQIAFLVDVLGYHKMSLNERQAEMGANWYEGADGSQVHLSEDPDHSPPRRAHVAVVCEDDELVEVERRLADAGVEVREFVNPDIHKFLVLKDPAGNRWEVRSAT